jgi:O-antigen ligase
MSNFYHDGSYSPAAEAVLDEPAVGTASAKAIEPEAPLAVHAPVANYSLFHYALLVYIYLFCTRLPELLPSIRLALAMSVVMLAGLFATGRGNEFFKTKLGRILTAFTVWTAICVPTSVWVGGSVDVLKGLVQSVLFVAFILAFARTMRELKNCMYVLGAAMGTVAVLSLTMFGNAAAEATTGLAAFGVEAPPTPGEAEQRLGLFHSATLADPNFMSLYLLIGLPFLWFGVRKGNWFTRALFFLFIPAVLVAIGHSASRMALVLFVIGLLMFLKSASSKERVFALASVTVLACVMVPFLPDTVTNRFMTLFHPKADSFESKEAADSAQVRLKLLVRSIEITAKHPLFGVGPGQFAVAENLLAKEEGKTRGIWYYTHNAYTQTSSEAGILALILYLMAIVTAYRGLNDIRKRGPTDEIREMAKAIQLSMWMVILGGLFLTTGFGGVPFVILGLAVSFKIAVAAQTRKTSAALPPA